VDSVTTPLSKPQSAAFLGKYDGLRTSAAAQRASTPFSFTNIWGDLDLINAIQIPKPRLGQDHSFAAQGANMPVPDVEAKGAVGPAGTSSGKSAANDSDDDDSSGDPEDGEKEIGDEVTDNASQAVLAQMENSPARKRKSSSSFSKYAAIVAQQNMVVQLALEMSRNDTHRGPKHYAPLKVQPLPKLHSDQIIGLRDSTPYTTEKDLSTAPKPARSMEHTMQAFFDKIAPNTLYMEPSPPQTWAQLYLAAKRLET